MALVLISYLYVAGYTKFDLWDQQLPPKGAHNLTIWQLGPCPLLDWMKPSSKGFKKHSNGVCIRSNWLDMTLLQLT